MIANGPVTLRQPEYEDMELLRQLINDPGISQSVVDFGFPVSSEQQTEWFYNILPNENAMRFIIEAGGVAVGSLVFARIDQENRTGEIGYKVLRAHQGHSYGSYAVCAVLPYLFLEKNIECVVACHLHTNLVSKRVLEKAGFVFEGVVRKAVYRNGERMDLWYWSQSRERFMQKAGDQNAV